MYIFLVCFLGVMSLFTGLSDTIVEDRLPDPISPLQIPALLSGNFGELRETHFHSGIDLKTGGKVGLPVICVKDGLVARVRVSPVGYGNTLYVEHADGTTTVYAHLQRFNPLLARLVREKQYEKESFEVDLDIKDYRVVMKQGDTLAYTGNTGSSGGPHLHFEYRDTRTEAVLNPLSFLTVKDHIAPKIRALYMYYMNGDGCVERGRRIVPKYYGERKYSCGRLNVPQGKNGIGLYLTDVMNDSWNKLGAYKIEMSVEGVNSFEWTVDTCLFACNPLVNEVKDFELYRQAKETVYRTFGHYIGRIPGVKVMEEGWIQMREGEERECLVKVADKNGNEVELRFTLVAQGEKILPQREVLDHRRSHTLAQEEYCLSLSDTALFASLPRMEKLDSVALPDGKRYKIFITSPKEQPLMNFCRISVQGCFDQNSVICRVTDKKSLVALPTRQGEKGIFAYTGILGCYTVVRDTVAPEVHYQGISGGKMRFTIRDYLAGIAQYRGEVNGMWGLFEYDAKNDLLSCRLSEPVFVRGANEVKLLVCDKAGNVTVKQVWVQTGK